MNAKFSVSVQKEIIKLQKKDYALALKIEKQIALFESNPRHPSLRLHKLSGEIENQWSISITMSIRMVYVLVDAHTALFTKIGTHEEVYKK